MNPFFRALYATSAFRLLALSAAAQGQLAPPGAPAPTMKTLDQVEPRTPVQGLAAVPPYIITQPGSYYLTGNITVSTGDAIRIQASGVTLDLNGFQITSTLTGSSLGTAISINGAASRITIRNGSIVSGSTVAQDGSYTVAGFLSGISGINNTDKINQALVENIHVSGVVGFGIYLNQEGLNIVQNCTARDCISLGICAGEVINCAVENCVGDAIYASSATNCSGSSVSGAGINCSYNASNCRGKSNSGSYGLVCSGTATSCWGSRNNGVAIQANIAIGCNNFNGNGTVNSPHKFLGTP